MEKNCSLNAATLTCLFLLIFTPAMAVEVSFQPRLEAGEMYYAFKSEATNVTKVSRPVPGQLGANFTQKAFEYSGYLPFIGAGATLFANCFFLDFCGQYASGGHDTTPIAYSAYTNGSNAFMATETSHTANFDRSDAAVSLGYAFSRQFGMFAGYKWARTQFNTTYQGLYSIVSYNYEDQENFLAGRIRGEADYRFEYQGPFVGAIHSWNCSHCRFLKGLFTISLALAYLDGKVVLDRTDEYLTANSLNGQPIPEVAVHISNAVPARYNTKGDAVGLTLGVGWRGATALEDLSYFLGMSGYRYEFYTEKKSQSDIKETAVLYKAGLTYVF